MTNGRRVALSADAATSLRERGFVVLERVVCGDRLARLVGAYDAAVAAADAADVRTGSASTRVNDFVNRNRGGRTAARGPTSSQNAGGNTSASQSCCS